MTILEFIRKNSILVIIVIVGVGAGLVMMDYAGKGSAFSRDFYVKVNGVGYNYPETVNIGSYGTEFIGSLIRATAQKNEQFDADGDGELNEQEAAAAEAWHAAHPEVLEFRDMLSRIYSMWHYGYAADPTDNVAINRCMLKAEAEKLGLRPSEQQIDDYLRSMPTFLKDDGSFDLELYQHLTGQRNGKSNRVQEEMFRDLIADLISWESLQAIIGEGVSFNTKTQLSQIDAFIQSVSGRTAWLPMSAVPTPEDPSEEELRVWWEAHKDAYKSAERRIVSIYTLSPTKDSNMENLLTTTDIIMQDLSTVNGQGLDKLLTEAANNPEHEPFDYLLEDGSTHHTYALSNRDELKERLTDEVNYNGTETPLAEVAFAEVTEAPGVEEYKAAVSNGSEDKIVSIQQIRGPYITKDDKVKLMRVEAIEAPGVLPYEEARGKALADYRAERAAKALQETADKLYKEMQATIAEQGLSTAFELAAQAGAQVENYGPIPYFMQQLMLLPEGVTAANILSTPSGNLAPLVVLDNGARFTSVDKRTVEDSPGINMQKRLKILPDENEMLRRNIIIDWINSSYHRYDVQLSPAAASRRKSENTESE